MEANYIQNVPKEVFQKFLESITECGGILEQLKFSLNSYSDSKFTNNKEIYKDKINISIWKRELGSALKDKANALLVQNPDLLLSEVLSPDKVVKILNDSINILTNN